MATCSQNVTLKIHKLFIACIIELGGITFLKNGLVLGKYLDITKYLLHF